MEFSFIVNLNGEGAHNGWCNALERRASKGASEFDSHPLRTTFFDYKMSEIKNIGKILTTDENGFIVNEASLEKIISPWKEVVEEVKNFYIKNLGDIVLSIYVRGSVSRGEAIKNISDVDTFAIISKDIKDIDRSWVKETQKSLKEKFPFVEGIEFGFIYYENLFSSDSEFINRFTIKTQSICIYGEDIAFKIESFRPDEKTVRQIISHANLRRALENAKNKITQSSSVDDIGYWCRFAMKRIIRAGFLLVMDQEKVFTRDLYPSYQLFSKYFPEHETKMKKALEWAINPIDNAGEITEFIDDFGVKIASLLEKKCEF